MVRARQWTVVSSVVLLLSGLFSGQVVQAGYSSNLEVKLSGLKNASGRVCLSLFSGPKGFPSGGKGSNLVTSRCVDLADRSSQVMFTNVPLGTYAIAVIHDSNRDGRLNTNPFGVPNEGFGFSNNPPLQFGPAKFSDSQVFVSGTTTVVQIQMRYLN